jgi:hypothetical protein
MSAEFLGKREVGVTFTRRALLRQGRKTKIKDLFD